MKGPLLSPNELLAQYDAEMRADPPSEDGILLERIGGIVRGTGNYNFVFFSRLSEISADAAIAEQVARFKNPPVELQWKIYGHDLPTNLGERLIAAGFQLGEPETLLVLRLSDCEFNRPASVGIKIRRVSDAAGLKDYIAVCNAVFERDENWRLEAYSRRLNDPTLGIYVAYADGAPVSGGRLDLPSNRSFAGIWGGATLSAFRGRGIYTNLVQVRAIEALQLGFKYLTVDARETSRPILESLGFVPLTSIRDYVLNKIGAPATQASLRPSNLRPEDR